MTDFRKVDIAKQKAYDLLRDWIKLVARHTNPDQEISELLGWLWKLKPANPDPVTGLVPCGCGGVPKWEEIYDGFFDLERVTCPECGIELTRIPGRCKPSWNRAMGWKEDAE